MRYTFFYEKRENKKIHFNCPSFREDQVNLIITTFCQILNLQIVSKFKF